MLSANPAAGPIFPSATPDDSYARRTRAAFCSGVYRRRARLLMTGSFPPVSYHRVGAVTFRLRQDNDAYLLLKVDKATSTRRLCHTA
jgi:hypothetical protein